MIKEFMDKQLNRLGKEYCAMCMDGGNTKWDPCYKCSSAWLNFEYKPADGFEWTGVPVYFRKKEEA